MLTEAEKKWLEGKSDADYPAPCVRTGKRGLFDMHYCLRACEGNSASSPKYCPIASDYRDAAEFEARVALKCVRLTFGELPCGAGDCADEHMYSVCGDCDGCIIRAARFAVEEEMEGCTK